MIEYKTFWEILRRTDEIIDRAKENSKYNDCEFFFRGEYHRYNPNGAPTPPPARETMPLINRDENLRKHEKELFYETIRNYPEFFRHDMKTIETLAKMQHYQVPTRLLDVTSDLRLATAMATIPFNSSSPLEYDEFNSFIFIYAVKKDRIKYSDSDTVTAITSAVKLDSDKVKIKEKDLGYLAYEAQKDRPGFTAEKQIIDTLISDLQHVWCVKPILSTERIRLQSGHFFLFGMGDRKAKLDATFSTADFQNPSKPTFGIERIDVIAINGRSKKSVAKNLERVGLPEYRYYPELSKFGLVYSEKIKNREV